MAIVSASALLAVPVPLLAEELEDVLDGFEDAAEIGDRGTEAPEAAREWSAWERFHLAGEASLGGSVSYLEHEATDGTEWRGLSRLRTRLDLQLDTQLPRSWKLRTSGFAFYDWSYLARGRHRFTDEVLDDYEWEVDFDEVWLAGSPLDGVDLKIGRQIENWGRSDTLRVLDVLNPLDNREPGLVDIERLRLPVAMAKLDWYLGSWTITGIAIPEIRFDKRPAFGSDFFPELELPLPEPPVPVPVGSLRALAASPERVPRHFHGNTEWAAAITGVFEGWDASLHFARFWRDEPHLEWDLTMVNPAMPELPRPTLAHSRLTLAGAGGNYVFGSWLLKAEIAYLDGIEYPIARRVRFAALPDSVLVPAGTVERSRIDAMGGLEYYGFRSVAIALEVANRRIVDFDDRMRTFGAQRDALETALRITGTFWNDRLRTTLLGVVFGDHAEDGLTLRLSADYDVRDALVFTAGVLLFESGDRVPFNSIADNDRLFFELRQHF